MNFKLASAMLARLFMVLAITMGVCVLMAVFWRQDAGGAEALGASALISLALSTVMGFFGRNADPTLQTRDALLVVTMSWFAAGVLGALPYFLSAGVPPSPGAAPEPILFHDAFFEALSGFTTTGSTILVNIEGLSDGLHAWRMFTHWLGGIGIVVIFVALFPQLGVGAKQLFKSEVPGPITEGLRPKIKQTALILTAIYTGLTALEALLLWGLTPMDGFTAFLHALSTMATGGFSTENASIAGFESVAVEWIIIIFMYLAGVNFALYFAALSGRARDLLRNLEWRTYTGLVVFFSLLIGSWLLLVGTVQAPEDAFRHATFQVLAIITTTGFGTHDFEIWPAGAQMILLGLMIVGGSAGSTAGGMKVSRILILIKGLLNQLARVVRPHTVSAVKLGRSVIRDDVVAQTYAFAFMWFLTAFAGALAISAMGVDVLTAATAAMTCTANVGPGLGDIGPTESFAGLPAAGKYVLTVCMVLGRLEFYTVLALLLRSTWRR